MTISGSAVHKIETNNKHSSSLMVLRSLLPFLPAVLLLLLAAPLLVVLLPLLRRLRLRRRRRRPRRSLTTTWASVSSTKRKALVHGRIDSGIGIW